MVIYMYQASKELNVKHSNPFNCICKYTNDDGSPIDLKGHTIKVDIKNSKEQLVSTTTVSIIKSELGIFSITSDKELPLVLSGLYLDIRDTVKGVSVNSDILKLNMSKVVTHG